VGSLTHGKGSRGRGRKYGLSRARLRRSSLREKQRAFTERDLMAMFGGAALTGPVLIMTLHSSRNTSLITLSVATFLFAVLLAFGATDSSGKDVRAATAAYAAVLIVFDGTSTPATRSE
jgi:hypothetical protein